MQEIKNGRDDLVTCRQHLSTVDRLYSKSGNYRPVDNTLWLSTGFNRKSGNYRLVDSTLRLSTDMLRIRVSFFVQELFFWVYFEFQFVLFLFLNLVSQLEKYSYFTCLYKGHCVLGFYYSTFIIKLLSFSSYLLMDLSCSLGSQIQVVLARGFEQLPYLEISSGFIRARTRFIQH